VDLRADSTVIIDPEQRFTLARRWPRWSTTTPHPVTLPEDK
jgi:hypothetical protein